MVIKSDECLDGEHDDCPVEHEVCECFCRVERPDEKLPLAESRPQGTYEPEGI